MLSADDALSFQIAKTLFPFRVTQFQAHAEVNNDVSPSPSFFHVSYQHILEGHVSVSDAQAVQVSDAAEQLAEHVPGLQGRQRTVLVHIVEELSAGQVGHDRVDVLVVSAALDLAHDVRMACA